MSLTAYLNGRFLPLQEAALPVWDYGIVQGATVTDMVRTFGGEPFRLRQHLERFAESRRVVGIELPESEERLSEIVAELIRQNREPIAAGVDLGVLMFATPGVYAGYAPPAELDARATLCVQPFQLALERFARGYDSGVALAIPTVRHVPAECIPPGIKHRSRLHWRLAELEARQIDPAASALLLDSRGFVTETYSGNLFVLRDGRLLIPAAETTLPGVSQAFVIEMAHREGLTVERADLTPEDVLSAEEAMLSSTTYCLLPVTRLSGQAIGQGRPGGMFQRLIRRWSDEVGVDIVAQARSAD